MIELVTGISESGYFDDRSRAQRETGPFWQVKQPDPAGCDVFADLAGFDHEADPGQFLEEFAMHQMNLTQIDLVWILRNT